MFCFFFSKMEDSKATAMTVTMVVCGVVTLVFMSARFAAKALVHAKLGIDDYALALSWVCRLHVKIMV